MDWIRLFEDHNIEFVTRGPNVSRNSIGIQCPWCGDDDPSQHLNVSLVKEAYGCWRSTGHGGHKPQRLVQALLGCSWAQAGLVTAQYSVADPSTLGEALAALEATSEPAKGLAGYEVTGCLMPGHFERITRYGSAERYWQYLRRRGFDDIKQLVHYYELKYCTTGRWKDRIIIPLYQQGDLRGWTARALKNPITAPRYLSSSDAVKTTIFNEDRIQQGGKLLFITEGPFDAMKMDFYGKVRNVRATAIFGLATTIGQICLLRSARTKFKQAVILLDHDAHEAKFKLTEWLPDAQVGFLPRGIKDPAELGKDRINRLIFDWLGPMA